MHYYLYAFNDNKCESEVKKKKKLVYINSKIAIVAMILGVRKLNSLLKFSSILIAYYQTNFIENFFIYSIIQYFYK